MASSEITLEIRTGPTFRAALDVLELAAEVLVLIPDWHKLERDELVARITMLREMCERQLVIR